MRAADEKAPANRGLIEAALSCARPQPVNPKSAVCAARIALSKRSNPR